MGKRITTALLVVILLFTVLNCLRLFVPPVETVTSAVASGENYTHLLTMQANQFALLQVYIAAFGIVLTALGIVLAVAAVYGYTELRASALKTAEEKISKDLPTLVKEQFTLLAPEAQAQLIAKVIMDRSPDVSTENAFLEGVKVMTQDPMNIPSVEDQNP